jgi:L-ascorbate metabolism protein UlaG (beta-lactamase superfamily)
VSQSQGSSKAHPDPLAITTVAVTYIANEGFLIETGDTKILIDALFGDHDMGYCHIPTKTTLSAMKGATGNFGDIDIIAVTHRHRDHFHAPFVKRHLTNNREGKLISCPQVTELLMSEDSGINFQERIVEVVPDSFSYIDKQLSGVNIRIYRLKHGPYYDTDPETGERIDRHQNVQNLGFLFEIDGIKIFHCGDSSPMCIEDYQHFKLHKEEIDLAFMGRGFLWTADGPETRILKELIKPDHLVLMHIHPDRTQRFIDNAQQIKDELPSVTVFRTPMESKTFQIH